MAKIIVKTILDKKTWENFILSNSPQSFLQSWNWGEVSKGLDKRIYRVGFYEGNKLSGASLVIVENAKRGKYLVIPGGPIIDWNSQEMVEAWLGWIKKIGKYEKAWFVRVRPELLDSEANRKKFKTAGFVSSPMHLHAENTWILDITKSEDELLGGMRKNTRYMVRKSMRSNLKIRRSTNSQNANILFDLQKETAKRHKFVAFSKKLFKTEIDKFSKDNQATLYVVEHEGKPIAAAIIIYFGDIAYYHYSASNEKARKIPASYFLQWNAILDAKKHGLKLYNFWGVAPGGEKNHRFSGVTLFKTGFDGTRIDWLGAHDLPLTYLYWATHIFEKLRKKYRNL